MISDLRPFVFSYFYPRPPRGGRLASDCQFFPLSLISIHALREEGDSAARTVIGFETISIHALREEGDDRIAQRKDDLADFYPRPPRGGRPLLSKILPKLSIFLSTPSARRATRRHPQLPRLQAISIHALREEGDLGSMKNESRRVLFLSTPSARRAT